MGPTASALTFDLFGTILDLGGSLKPAITELLAREAPTRSPEAFWDQWRTRQRLEQYQDTIMMVGHAGYLETVRRALHYVFRLNEMEPTEGRIQELMAAWPGLLPFPEVVPALERLRKRYRLVVLSNGDPHFLDHLVEKQVEFTFDDVISATGNGAFKPHPGVYRRAAHLLGLEVNECLMVSANAFDCVGARACGFQAVYVDRYKMPVEDTPFQPALTVEDFTQLADALL
ncbi:MAG: haloacid dehalogenase type II [Caldilineaceae bacterium SB0668_bin_21]|nr:haloacid dehalogenase type II [Caldilineaceae bacterium SB0668_bin_21]MYC21362.1 haloacid dehalogenase type II [Caldilineaceae bacterium SB0662_bin_25]